MDIEEIINDIEAAYVQSILKIYASYTHSNDENLDTERTKTNYYHKFGYLEIFVDPEKDVYSNFTGVTTISFKSPIPLDKRAKDKIYHKIAKINKEYISGFLQFLELTEGRWFKPLNNINMESILGYQKMQRGFDDYWLYYKFRSPQTMRGLTVVWLNLYLYEYRKKLPSIRKYKKVVYEKENVLLSQELKVLKSKFSINMETEDFHSCSKRIETIQRRLSMDFEDYYNIKCYKHTPDDTSYINFLKTSGYPIDEYKL